MGETVSGSGEMVIGGETLTVSFTVPAGACDSRALLPDVRRLTDQVTAKAESRAAEAGRTVSCRRGCHACCRQVVPISTAEARRLAELVDAQSPERADDLRRRFETVRRHMQQAAPRPGAKAGVAASVAYALAWFRQGLDCPFLEEGACSIYADRPITSREYLVTSPPEGCETLDPEVVQPLTRAVSVANALAWTTGPGKDSWIPLTDALAYVAATPASAERGGPEWALAFFENLKDAG
ncbi:MAG: YkgJ family cysteine cluster protein [Caulobacterales bacterium]|nr:YkgJ family cysteine cluster protein [Caulobacterales bacterium]